MKSFLLTLISSWSFWSNFKVFPYTHLGLYSIITDFIWVGMKTPSGPSHVSKRLKCTYSGPTGATYPNSLFLYTYSGITYSSLALFFLRQVLLILNLGPYFPMSS
uniref:Uncharacterized protein n=1 Tax=Cacopsylla melanoneura TaxID=428564 RepID=A0A8D9BQ45_9HEMI